RNSLFERLFLAMKRREEKDGIKRTVTLDVQYRMHPVLGDFVSDTFYKPHGEVFRSGRPAVDFTLELEGYKGIVAAWKCIPLKKAVDGESGKMSKKRAVEASWIAGEVHRLMTERPDLSFGVISFYAAQVQEILREMDAHHISEIADDGTYVIRPDWTETSDSNGRIRERLRVGTVDAFQGKEFDVVFLSMTRSNNLPATDEKALRRKYGHLMLENRLCVSMSRQQRLLIVAGDEGMLKNEAAPRAIPGLVAFYKLCGGEHGVRI
ncbi:AAA domain-containing protein, partial [Thermodesulfobacteriota bacterium]